jgi:hypothetical protein
MTPRTSITRIVAVPRSCICGWVPRKNGNQRQPTRWVRVWADPDCPWHRG